MFRLKVKVGKKFRLGIRVYNSREEAERRKKEMEKVGHVVKIVETTF